MGVLDDTEGTTESKLGAMDAAELEAMRELCQKYWSHLPRESWNVIVTEDRHTTFAALRDAGFCTYEEGVAALRISHINICGYLIGPQASR